jgi:hypothetical protein
MEMADLKEKTSKKISEMEVFVQNAALDVDAARQKLKEEQRSKVRVRSSLCTAMGVGLC